MADTQSFRWVGINSRGKRVTGAISANNVKDAQAELKKNGIEVIDLQLKRSGQLALFSQSKPKIKAKDILLFTRYLSTMLIAGLPIIQAMDIIANDQSNVSMHDLILTIKSDISGGKTLAESFKQFPQHFSELYFNLVSAGEKSGTLDKILNRLATYMEKTETMKRKVKKALIYPAAILTVALMVSLILLVFVVPQFEKIFGQFGAQLPAFTQMIVNLSSFLRTKWWLLLGILVGAVGGLRYLLKTSEHARIQLDRWSLQVMIIGPVLRKSIIARFSRTLATTMEAGMPIVESMKSMAPIMGNRLYSRAVLQICEDLVSGHQLSVAMESTKLFPNMAIQMIAVGEVSGSLSDMLNKVADYYEEEVNQVVDNLSSLLEPLIMVVLGVIVGSFVIAMYLPIFKMGSLF